MIDRAGDRSQQPERWAHSWGNAEVSSQSAGLAPLSFKARRSGTRCDGPSGPRRGRTDRWHAGREVSGHENRTETRRRPKVPLQGTGAGARSNGARPIREQRKRIDPSTKPKPNQERLDSLGDTKQEQGTLQSRKSAATSPPDQTRRCQRAQATEEAMSQPRDRQRAHVLAERAEKRAATKSGRSSGSGGPQSASSTTRGLSIALTQTSEQGIKAIVL